MDAVLVKWVHVLSSTLLFGTGIGSAFYLFFVSLTRDTRAVAVVAQHVVVADWIFTASTVVLQPVSGLYLVDRLGYPWQARWIVLSLALYAFAVACWLPVVWLQYRLRDIALAADDAGAPLPPAYWRHFRWWTALGVPAFLAFLAILWLMVARPS